MHVVRAYFHVLNPLKKKMKMVPICIQKWWGPHPKHDHLIFCLAHTLDFDHYVINKTSSKGHKMTPKGRTIIKKKPSKKINFYLGKFPPYKKSLLKST